MSLREEYKRLKSLQEQEIVKTINSFITEQEAPMAPPAQPPAAAPVPTDPSQAQPPVEATQEKTGDLTIDDLIEKLNTIRGGRSFDEPEVYSDMEKLLGGLDPSSKEVIKNFVTELSRIVTLNTQQGGEVQQAGQNQPPAPPAQPPAQAPAPQAAPPAPAPTPV